MNDIKFWHRIQLPDGTYTPGIVNHGPDGGDWPTTRFGMPGDLTGNTVIDVGCRDGFFSFEAEKRGAERIFAVDVDIPEALIYCKEKLNSKVEYGYLDIQNFDGFGVYDIVLCYGVLYHLKNPLAAMENLSSITREVCLIETAVSAYSVTAMLEYLPGCAGDPYNYFYPNDKWMEVCGKEVGFRSVEKIFSMGTRSTYRLIK